MDADSDPRRGDAVRVVKLGRLGAMRRGADPALQELVDDAREVFGTQFCLVNLVTPDEQYFAARSGEQPAALEGMEEDFRGHDMCRYVVEGDSPIVVEDFSATERFAGEHARIGPSVRFYAGAPLKTSDGHVVGTFCLLDGRPRGFDARDLATLRTFARAAVGRLEALDAAARERRARESERRYRRNVFERASDAILIYGAETGLIMDANRRSCEMYGIPQGGLVGKKFVELSSQPEGEEEHSRALLRRGARGVFETVHRRGDGTPMHVSISSSVIEYGGRSAILSIVRDVTERKRTEEALRLREESLAQAQRIARIGNWEHEVGTNRTRLSDEMYRICGLAPRGPAPSYKTFMALVHPDDRERVRRSIRGALRGDGPQEIEYRIVRPDGEVRLVRMLYEGTRDGAGRPAEFFGTVQDITDRRQVERRLGEAEEKYRLLVEQIPAVAYIDRADVADVAMYTSPRIEALLGYTPEEWLKENLWLERLHPDDRDWVVEEDDRARAAEEPFGEEYRLIAKDGRVVWVRDESALLRDEAGRPLLWQGVLLDVTERKQAEEALRRSERRFRSLIQNAPDVIMVLAEDSTILYDSPAIERTLGYKPGERLGSKGFDYVHPEDLEQARRMFARALGTPRVGTPVEYRLRHKDGSWRHFEAIRTNLLDDPGVGGIVINARDVTERRRAEEALKKGEEGYRRQARELELLHRVRTALARGMELPTLFRTVVEAIARTYGYTQVSCYLLRDATLVLQHQVGYEQVLRRIPVAHGVMGRTIRTGRPILIGDVRSEPDFLGAIEGLTSEVCVPLFDEGEVMGVLNIESKGGVELAEDDLRLMSALAEHVNVAIGRSRLHTRVRESEERFRSLIHNASDVVTLLEVDGTVRYQSPSVERILGYGPEELVGGNAFAYIHPDDLDRVRDAFSEMLADPGLRPSVEYRFRHRDGSWRYLESIGSNLLEDPRVGELVINSRDVTERRRWEEKLRQAEERYRGLVETVPAITYVGELDEVSTSIYISPQVESILGFTAEERMATPDLWVRHLHPEDRERVLAANDRSNATGDPFEEEYRMITRDGREVWVYDASVVLRGGEGRPSYRQGVMFDVTERRRTERALHASETRMRTVIEQSPLGIHIFAPDGTSLLANDAWDELWYLDAEEIARHANVFEDDILRGAGLIRHIERSVAENVPVVAPLLLFDPADAGREGDARWLRALIYPVRGGDGRLLETVLLLEDVTERKRAEDALKESEERFRSTFEDAPIGVALVSLPSSSPGSDRRYLRVNRALCEMLGYPEEDLLSKTTPEITHPEDVEKSRARVERLLEEGETKYTMEKRYVRPGGRVVWAMLNVSLVRDSEGKPSHFVSQMQDVTERKQIEDALKEGEERYRAVVEQSAEAIWLFDPETKRVLEANAAFQEMLGYGIEELRNMTNYDFVAHSRENVDRAVARKLEGGETLRAERKYRRRDGTLLDVEVGGTVISYGGKRVVCSAARDITARKRAEEEMREANRRLGELATLRADFTAMVAHELDTPLAVIRGYADVLAVDELGAAERERALAVIQTETEVLNALVEDVRVAASAEREDFTVNPRKVPTDELLGDAARFAATLPGEHPLVLEGVADGIPGDGVQAGYADQFIFNGAGDRQEVWADRYRIGQVLRNLLTNAVKYSPEGSPILLRAVPAETPGRVRIEVVDRGPGIHADDVERIFEKFGRGRDPDGRKVAGLGLGLYLSRRILRAHGSNLTVDVAPEGGSVFGFDLEAADE